MQTNRMAQEWRTELRDQVRDTLVFAALALVAGCLVALLAIGIIVWSA